MANTFRSPDAEVRVLAGKLQGYAKGRPEDVPSLEEALGGRKATAKSMRIGQREGIGAILASGSRRKERQQSVALSLGSQMAEATEPVETFSSGFGGNRVSAARSPRGARPPASAPDSERFPHVVPTIHGPLPKVSRKEPGFLVFLADGSWSMRSAFGSDVTRAEALADVINGSLGEFVRANNQGGLIQHRWNVAALRYGGTSVRSAWEGELAGRARSFNTRTSFTEIILSSAFT